MTLFRKKHQIQDFTQVKNVGEANQQMAGHEYELNEPGSPSSNVLGYFKFNHSDIYAEESGKADFTVGVAPTSISGIHGAGRGIHFNGTSQYITHPTLLSVSPTYGLIIDHWFYMDNYTFNSHYLNKITPDSFYLDLRSEGITITSSGNPGVNYPICPLGGWHHVMYSIDPTNGTMIHLDGKLVKQDITATVLPTFTTGGLFYLGSWTGPNYYWEGSIDLFRARDKVINQKDVDVCMSVPYTWSQSQDMPLSDVDLIAFTKEDGHDDFVAQYKNDFEVARYNDKIYRYGDLKSRSLGGYFNPTDKLKIVGRI